MTKAMYYLKFLNYFLRGVFYRFHLYSLFWFPIVFLAFDSFAYRHPFVFTFFLVIFLSALSERVREEIYCNKYQKEPSKLDYYVRTYRRLCLSHYIWGKRFEEVDIQMYKKFWLAWPEACEKKTRNYDENKARIKAKIKGLVKGIVK